MKPIDRSQRAMEIGLRLIETNKILSELALEFGISKATAWRDIRQCLPKVDPKLADACGKIIDLHSDKPIDWENPLRNKYEIRGDVAVIFLENRKGEAFEALIDVGDLEKVSQFPGYWYPAYEKDTDTYYVHGRKFKEHRTTYRLHRWLFGEIPRKLVVDHINHDTLDNRRSVNLRVVDETINQLNIRGPRSTNQHGYRNVTWSRGNKKWLAHFGAHGKKYYLGYYDDPRVAEEVAKKARTEYIKKYLKAGENI